MLEDKEIQREKLILNMSVEGFWDWDLQTDQFYLSPSFCERIGYSSVTTLFDIHFIKMIIHPDDHQKIASLIDKVVYEKQETAIVSCRIISKDGSVHWFESRCGIVACNEDGIASRMVGTLIDITRQKQMESELQRLTGTLLAISNCNQVLQSEARYRSLFENKHTVMLIIDPENGSILDANPAAVIYYGWKRDELCNMNISQINMLNKAEIQAEMQLALAEKRNFFLFRHLLRDSSVRDVEVVSGPISIKGKSLLYSIITDITERKQAEQELRQSEERFRKLFQSHAVVNILLDPDTGNIVDANPSAADFYGWSVDELKQMNIRQINPISVKEIKKNLEKSRLSKQNKFQFLHGRSDGSLRDVEVFSSKIEIAGKELLYVTVFDVTHKKLAEEALRESERKFRTITEQIAEMVFVSDTKGVLTYPE